MRFFFFVDNFKFLFDVCACYFSSDTKLLKQKGKTEVAGSNETKSVVAKINPSLYANLIIDDLTNTSMYLLVLSLYVD